MRKSFAKKGVTIGARDVVFAKLISDDASGTQYAEDVYSAPGAMEIAMTVSISDEVLGADDNPVWAQLASLDSVDVALTLASIEKKGQAYLLGHRIDANGVMIESSNDIAPEVAMGFKAARHDGTDDYIWLYKGQFKPSDKTYHTKEKGTVNWQNPVINSTFGPRDFDKNIKITINTGDVDVPDAVKATFFDTVYEPSAETEPEQP